MLGLKVKANENIECWSIYLLKQMKSSIYFGLLFLLPSFHLPSQPVLLTIGFQLDSFLPSIARECAGMSLKVNSPRSA